MDATIPDTDVVRTAVDLACRAPSVHNSQPWQWRYDAGRLDLYADPARLLVAADPRGRQLLISCGAALHHLTVAMASLRWRTHIDLLPRADGSRQVASVRFTRDAQPRSHDFDLLAAIRRRRTDRTAFSPLPDPLTAERLRAAAGAGVTVTVLPEDARPALVEATELSSAVRRYDASYQAELRWWAGHDFDTDGIPDSALATANERAMVSVGRAFPDPFTPRPSAAPTVVETGADRADASTVLMLGTPGDEPADWIRCGQALSAITLEATIARLATCTLTHLTDVDRSREVIRELAPDAGVPQLLIRVGTPTHPAPMNDTPRRSVSQVLTFA
ncbi:Acg family FMN-binding oxidoreductase [Rhodococcus sp. NPDC003318]|uniref:Acg family FMN-binding oxidoreductase n=1 Tax=Rhodococcus sp. NPDC003318 TaxID=3364503 RepID=UPI0036B92424